MYKNLRSFSNFGVELKNEIEVSGWIKSFNILKNKTFIRIKDGRKRDLIQIVFNNNDLTEKISVNSFIKVLGEPVKSVGKQDYEIKGNKISFCSSMVQTNNSNSELFPESSKNKIDPSLLRHKLLHFRHHLEHYAALCRIKASMNHCMRNVLYQSDYLEVDTPCLTKIDCEGGGECYQLSLNNETNINYPKLTVSRQLHLEALTMGFGKVYSCGPIFRANSSHTRNHLSEFTMLELESVELYTTEHLCAEIENIIKNILKQFLNKKSNIMDLEIIKKSNIFNDSFNVDLNEILVDDFIIITYNDSLKLLKKYMVNDVISEKGGLTRLAEQNLLKLCSDNNKIKPIFVIDFPKSLKPFYCQEKIDNVDLVDSVDLLFPYVGELVGGSIREIDVLKLKESIDLNKLNDFDWYVELREYCAAPHGGFGLGWDRFIQFVTGVYNIQDVVNFPRTIDNCRL